MELEQRIQSEILDNPALEEGKEMPDNEDDNTEYAENEDENTESNEDFSLGDYSNEDDIPDYKLQEHNPVSYTHLDVYKRQVMKAMPPI